MYLTYNDIPKWRNTLLKIPFLLTCNDMGKEIISFGVSKGKCATFIIKVKYTFMAPFKTPRLSIFRPFQPWIQSSVMQV